MPLIQIKGYCAKPICSIKYDIYSTNVTSTNNDGSISAMTPNSIPENAQDYIPDIIQTDFQCFDVPLDLGTNLVVLHVVDYNGNETNLNLHYTLNVGTQAPTINPTWPSAQDNTTICGDNFTISGTLDNPTAVVYASVVDSTGTTNLAFGVVDRDGGFLIEDVPLPDGVSGATLTALVS
jgi:hypothetical protein